MARNLILWSGGVPSAEAASLCQKRDLELRVVGEMAAGDVLAQAKGLVLCWPQKIDRSVTAALQHGAVPIILCDFTDIPAAGLAIEKLAPGDGKSFIFIETDQQTAIRRICREDDTPSSNSNVEPVGHEDLNDEEKLLLSRAFADCSRVQLVPELGGSGHVFQAYARLRDSRAGPVAMPFFVKFGRRGTIKRELLNYRECTTLHVPFNQRPNVDPARCALGFASGIIVGNFVERSESLQVVVDRGAGLAPLQSLFNSALRGWRQQAHIEGSAIVRKAVLAAEMKLCLPSTYKPSRRDRFERHVALAQKVFGSTLPCTDLERRLRALPAIQFRVAIAHNDLHGENVRVAGQDAILIDFTWTDHGPLSADPASLDVSLVLNTEAVDGDEWVNLAKSLYSLEALMHPPLPFPPEEKGSRVADAIRFIRQIALPDTIDPIEYPTAIGLQLLRKASYRHQPRRAALAYALAEKLTVEIENAFRARKAETTSLQQNKNSEDA